jgi:hypothetical protein
VFYREICYDAKIGVSCKEQACKEYFRSFQMRGVDEEGCSSLFSVAFCDARQIEQTNLRHSAVAGAGLIYLLLIVVE